MNHAMDLQIFQSHEIVSSNQGMSKFIELILSAVGNIFVLTFKARTAFSAILPPEFLH